MFSETTSGALHNSLSSGEWDEEELIDALFEFLADPSGCGALMVAMSGRVHLPDVIQKPTGRLSLLFIAYIKRMAKVAELDSALQLLLTIWAYQLTNTFFVLAGSREGVRSWTRQYYKDLDQSFLSGLNELEGRACTVLNDDGGRARLSSALRDLRQELGWEPERKKHSWWK